MPVMNINHFSMYLKYSIDCTVILPEKIKDGERLKCLWLYHGGSGDHKAWLYHSPIVEHAEKYHIAVVLPTAHESCFVDMNYGDRFGSYMGKELPVLIHNMFSCISSKREDNYISGFSNGGYGCFHVGLSNPDKFSVIGAFSAGDKADADFPNDGGAKSINRIRLFGDGDLHQNQYGLTYIANQLIEKNVDKPRIYHACGGQDPWLDANH
ncbi:MAG: alpha/beta hydrolase-fold protein, partial [Lachnospira sp.]|nr:alpha/beta hydrolase-fold protein [Lachnospira sp.]